MPELSEYAVRLAILRFPEAFGLKDEDVNPFIAYTLIMAKSGEDIIDHESILDECVVETIKTLDSKTHLILSGRAPMPDIPERKAPQPPEKREADNDRKDRKGKPKDRDGKITVKQLRYIGYLKHKMGDKPDYDEIEKLSQKSATMLIKDLEKEVTFKR